MERWTPKAASLILDGITPGSHLLFRYILTRNGHNVALFGGLKTCVTILEDRKRRFPADDWGIVDRRDDGISASSPDAVAGVEQERKAGR